MKKRRPPLESLGERFGRLVVVDMVIGLRRTLVRCECDCGSAWEGALNHLRKGNTESCGCLFIDKVTKHGLHDHPLYDIWDGIRKRTMNPQHEHYKDYGGRGIVMEPEWRDSPTAFIAWVTDNLGPRPSLKHSIDRIDNEHGSYVKGNLKWSTQKEQCNNKRNNVFVEVNGVVKPLAQWAEDSGIGRETIACRLRAGWPASDAVSAPLRTKRTRGV